MFNSLRNRIKELNSDVNIVTNSEEASKLRKKILLFGIPMLVVGIIGVITCFVFLVKGVINYTQSMMDSVKDMSLSLSFPTEILLPFFILIPCFFVLAIGGTLTSLGLRIAITGHSSNFINKTVGDNCPNCGTLIVKDNSFCSKCGTKLTKKCPNCNHDNDYKNDYCVNCGTPMNDNN